MKTDPMPPGWRLVAHEVLDSTNAEIRRLTGESTHGTVVWARRQTAGRGRGARLWDSPVGNLSFSVLLRPGVPQTQFALASFVAGIAVVEAVPSLHLACKWPNDVLCGGRKLAGILLEGDSVEGRLSALIVGIGVNVAWAPTAQGLHHPATSLAAEGIDVSVEEVLGRVCHSLAIWLDRWHRHGFAPVREAWLARAAGVGTPMTVRLDDDHAGVSGLFAGLDHDGAALLKEENGTMRRILAGDVFFKQGTAEG